VHQNAAQVSDAVVLRECIEHLVSDRVTGGDEVTEHSNPPGALEDLLSPFRRVVLQKKPRDTRRLGLDLAVGSGQQLAHTSFRGTRQTALRMNIFGADACPQILFISVGHR
jgi:DNA-binding sugar fermentation-stimulating protein